MRSIRVYIPEAFGETQDLSLRHFSRVCLFNAWSRDLEKGQYLGSTGTLFRHGYAEDEIFHEGSTIRIFLGVGIRHRDGSPNAELPYLRLAGSGSPQGTFRNFHEKRTSSVPCPKNPTRRQCFKPGIRKKLRMGCLSYSFKSKDAVLTSVGEPSSPVIVIGRNIS